MVQQQEKPAEADEGAARQTASDVAEDAQNNGTSPEDLNSVEFRNGLKLGVREVPPLILRQPLQKLPEPEPPMIDMSDKGEGLTEPNPNDPAYIKVHAEWELTVGLSIMDTMMLLGTTEPTETGEPKPLIETLPEGMFPPESDGWVNWLKAAGVTIDESTVNTRYLCWLRYYAVSNSTDLAKLTRAIAGKSGVREEDVGLAADAFSGDTSRGTDTGPASKPNRKQRRELQRANSRDGGGDRGKRQQ